MSDAEVPKQDKNGLSYYAVMEPKTTETIQKSQSRSGEFVFYWEVSQRFDDIETLFAYVV